jgi:hypothetical protein
MKIRPEGAKVFHADGETDKTKLTVASRNSTNALQNRRQQKITRAERRSKTSCDTVWTFGAFWTTARPAWNNLAEVRCPWSTGCQRLARLGYFYCLINYCFYNSDSSQWVFCRIDTKIAVFIKLCSFNPLKTKRICFIQGLSAYRAVNTLHFGYKNQSLNVL